MATELQKEHEEELPIFKNRLVPAARILKEDEEKSLLEKYNITKQQLPRIQGGDVVIKHLSANSGNIIEFKRTNPSAGISTYYRVVVGVT